MHTPTHILVQYTCTYEGDICKIFSLGVVTYILLTHGYWLNNTQM